MKTLKLTIKRLFNTLLNLLLIRKKKYYVTGMRRSGNHAFINWLKNALEGEEISFYNPKNERKVLVTPSGSTVFINHLNNISVKNYFRILLNHLFIIIKSKNVIISTEDYTQKNNFKIPDCHYNFIVKRSLLNLIASRYKKMLNGIQHGRCLDLFNIDNRFFSTLKKLYSSKEYIPWDYDEWLVSSEYRRNFLMKLNLDFDSDPKVSSKGGGSSFSGSILSEKSELLQRYKLVDIPPKIIENLYREGCEVFLTDVERNYLAEKISVQ